MLKQKLSGTNGLLAKVRYYLSPKLLRTLYFSTFESHFRYGCQIWGQHSNHNANLQYKSIQLINFKNKCTTVESLFKGTKIMTPSEIIKSAKLPFGLTSHKPMPAFKSKKLTYN